jgi:hypothetical protein
MLRTAIDFGGDVERLCESGSRVARIPTHRIKQRRDEWGTRFGVWVTRQFIQ